MARGSGPSRGAVASNARQDVEALEQVRVCVAQCFEVSIDCFDLAVDPRRPNRAGQSTALGLKAKVAIGPVFVVEKRW
jgi:hypothetical protein